MFLMSSADFKNRGILQEEFPRSRVVDFANCPGFLILFSAPVLAPKFPNFAKLFSL